MKSASIRNEQKLSFSSLPDPRVSVLFGALFECKVFAVCAKGSLASASDKEDDFVPVVADHKVH